MRRELNIPIENRDNNSDYELGQKDAYASLNNKDSLNSLDDVRLWELFREGKEIAFTHIYGTHFKGLFQYGCQFTKNESLVEDALQDMFIELREKREKTIIQTSIRNYLFTCLRRRILLYKKKFNDHTTNFEHSEFRLFEIEISTEQKIIDEQIKTDNKKKLKEVIKLITNRQREAIYCLYYEGLNYEEIKELMGFTNIRSVRNLIYRALAHMKSALSLFILWNCY